MRHKRMSLIDQSGPRCVYENCNYLRLPLNDTIRYDTIRYDIFTCTQKLTKWPAQSSRSAQKKIRRNQKQKPINSEETVRVNVRGSSPGGRSQTTGNRIREKVGIKPKQ